MSDSSRKGRPTRKLSWQSRMRGRFRHGADRVLAADPFWSGTFVLVAVFLLGSQQCATDLPELRAGQPAPFDVKAPVGFTDTNDERTEQRRQAAVDAVPEVYRHDTGMGMRLEQDIGLLFVAGRGANSPEETASGVATPLIEELNLDPEPRRVLEKNQFDPELERELRASLNHVMGHRIVTNLGMLERQPAITLISSSLSTSSSNASTITDYDSFLDIGRARELARKTVRERLSHRDEDERVLGELVASYVDANVLPDAVATKQRRDDAASRVRPWREFRSKGEVLVPEGTIVNTQHLRTLRNAQQSIAGGLNAPFIASLFFVASTLSFFLYRYSHYQQRHFRKIQHLHALLILMLTATLLLAKALLWLAGEIVDGLASPYNQLSLYNYVIPLGAGSILVTLLANGRIALVYSSFVSLLFGSMNGWSPWLILWAMLVQGVGVYAISTDRERSAALRAGLIVGVVGALSVFAVEGLQGSWQMPDTAWGATLAFLGGAVGVGLLISFTLPILEKLFNVLTDIRLLELSNVNNPLLSQLAVKAPGSYNHSLVVGTLAEEGAKAIGASSLFCRVAAFYHDIGKMEKPEYYVENQRGVNPHDRLSPSMSALIIASHVKDGIKLAREAGLPEQIVDIIPQHHGTKLMKYFYERAKSTSDDNVEEKDFRYPGPKPQTREGAIFMLADSVEAAARTVEEPTPNRLRDVIQKVSNAIVVDGQFEECDMTFADLQKIQDAFHRLLVSMYHHRVDYPGFDFNKPKTDGKTEGKPELRAVSDEPSEKHVARGS